MRFAFACPRTEERFAFDHDMDRREVEKMWHRRVNVTCPACHHLHAFEFSECYEGEIAQ
jgi:hypothetical protein